MSWHEYGGKYDPADYVVPPELGKGKSIRIQAYIQANHYRLLNILARSGVFPFEERQDVIRWCILFGLKHLDTLEPGLTRSEMSGINMMNRRNQETLNHMKQVEWIETSKAAIGALAAQGQDDQAREEVMFMYREILKIPDEPDRTHRWKCQMLDALRANFAKYLPDDV